MKKYIFVIFIVISIIAISCSGKYYQKQGIVSWHVYFINVEDSTQLPFNNLESKIWFKDSCVIFEMKELRMTENTTSKGSVVKRSFDLFKYSYLDLRTMKCQDYSNFSDTAMPFNNYQLEQGESPSVVFYANKRKIEISDSSINMTDTTIQNKVLKRIKMVHIYDSTSYEYVYYIDCNIKKNIFHINISIDEMFPGCQVIKSESRANLNTNLKNIFEFNMLKQKLSSTEAKIFDKWQRNAIQTKLPLVDYLE